MDTTHTALFARLFATHIAHIFTPAVRWIWFLVCLRFTAAVLLQDSRTHTFLVYLPLYCLRTALHYLHTAPTSIFCLEHHARAATAVHLFQHLGSVPTLVWHCHRTLRGSIHTTHRTPRTPPPLFSTHYTGCTSFLLDAPFTFGRLLGLRCTYPHVWDGVRFGFPMHATWTLLRTTGHLSLCWVRIHTAACAYNTGTGSLLASSLVHFSPTRDTLRITRWLRTATRLLAQHKYAPRAHHCLCACLHCATSLHVFYTLTWDTTAPLCISVLWTLRAPQLSTAAHCFHACLLRRLLYACHSHHSPFLCHFSLCAYTSSFYLLCCLSLDAPRHFLWDSSVHRRYCCLCHSTPLHWFNVNSSLRTAPARTCALPDYTTILLLFHGTRTCARFTGRHLLSHRLFLYIPFSYTLHLRSLPGLTTCAPFQCCSYRTFSVHSTSLDSGLYCCLPAGFLFHLFGHCSPSAHSRLTWTAPLRILSRGLLSHMHCFSLYTHSSAS